MLVFRKDLANELRSELSGDFLKLMLAAVTPTEEYLAHELTKTIDKNILMEILCTSSNSDIRSLSQAFQTIHNVSLSTAISEHTSGHFRELMLLLCAGNRYEGPVSAHQAHDDARQLKKSGIERWGTDESTFIRILSQRSFAHVSIIATEYAKISKNPLEIDIKKEFSGDIRDALVTIVQSSTNRAQYFAEKLQKSMKGIGTDDKSLIRLCVWRCEIDMADIKEIFHKMFGESLKSYIRGDTSGDYRQALYTLIGESEL
jgi:annexin A7/11